MPTWPLRWRRFRHLPGLAILVAALFYVLAVPLMPFLGGIAGNTHPAYARHVPSDADAIFLSTHRGEMELYPWAFPLARFPADAPLMHVGMVKDIFVSRPALDLPSTYNLIDLKSQRDLPLRTQKLPNGRQMRMIPLHPIPPGHYLFLTPTAGMDGGNVWYYFAVTARGGRT